MPKGILNKASLVMVPEAPIDGTMPSVFPEDRSGDFTFTRGSNLAATRVASNGLIEKGRENLLYPSDLSAGVGQVRCSITLNAADPYGGTEAVQFITSLDASTTHYILKTVAITAIGQVMTMSVTAKANGYDFFRIEQGNNSRGATFNLSDGTIDNYNGIAASIESVGNGWYRCSVAALTISTSFAWVALFMPTSSVSYTGDGVSGGFLYGAQLEAGLVATSVISTGASTGKAGLLENEPRIDFTGGGCGSLLLEPSRTQLIPQSEYFGDTQWSIDGVLLDANNTISPEGLQNAYKITDNTSTGYHKITKSNVFTADGTMRTWSVFVKKENARYCIISHAEIFSSYVNSLIFDMQDGVYTNEGTTDYFDIVHDPVDMGNGWWRIGFSSDLNSTGYDNFSIGVSQGATWSGNVSYTGDGSLNFFIYGAQLEVGSYPTSYIPTHGNIVTRSLDAMNNSSLGLTDCTFFVDFVPRSSIMGLLDFYDNSNARAFYIAINSVNYLQFNSVQGGTIGDVIGPITIGNKLKLAFTLNASTGDVTIFVNGAKYGTYSTTISSLNKILQVASFGYYNNTEFNQISAFPTALTDEECSALTQP